MKVSDLMTREVITVDTEETVKEIAIKMRDNRASIVLVVRNNELLGVITDRRLALGIGCQAKDASKIKAKELMLKNVVSVQFDTDLVEAAKIFEKYEIRYLPVLEEKKLVGIMSISNIADFIKEYIDSIFVEPGVREKKSIH